MNIAAITVFAIYASQIGYADTNDSTTYDNWIERVIKTPAGPSKTVHRETVAPADR